MPSLPSGFRSKRRDERSGGAARRSGGVGLRLAAPPVVGALLAVAMTGWGAPWARAGEAPQPGDNPFAGSAAAAADGQRLFKQLCGPCHGFDARGGQGPDLTDERWAHGGSDAEIYWSMASGVPGTRMREFGSLLTGEELWKIVTFIRSAAGSAGR